MACGERGKIFGKRNQNTSGKGRQHMAHLEDSPQALKVTEFARALSLGTRTVYRLIEDGEVQAIRVGRGPKPSIRIPATELARLLAAA